MSFFIFWPVCLDTALETFSYFTRKHIITKRMIYTSTIADPTPINTPRTGEMINLVFKEPIFDGFISFSEILGFVVKASSITFSY